jgi:outer membrane lipoprotein-sorting protein
MPSSRVQILGSTRMKRLSRLLLAGAVLTAATRSASADEKADALLKQVAANTRAISSLSAELSLRQRAGALAQTWRGRVDLKRPNLARILLEQNTPDGVLKQQFVSDGKTVWHWTSWNNLVQTSPADPDGRGIEPLFRVLPIPYFFVQLAGYFGPDVSITTRYVGEEMLDGKTFQHVEVAWADRTSRAFQLYIGPDGLLHRSVISEREGGDEHTFEGVLSNIRTGKAMSAATFRFTPPRGATERRIPTREEREKRLLAIGQPAPLFSLPMPGGGAVTLADALKGRPATLINFWFYG